MGAVARLVEEELGTREMTSSRKLRKILQQSLSDITSGRPLSSATTLAPKVRLQRREAIELIQDHVGDGIALEFDDDAITIAIGLVRADRKCLDLLSRRTSSAMRSTMVALFTWYGISVTMIASRSLRRLSISTLPRMTIEPAAEVVGRARMPWRAENDAAGREVGPGTMRFQVVDAERRIVDQGRCRRR